jgi:hypothetical protein
MADSKTLEGSRMKRFVALTGGLMILSLTAIAQVIDPLDPTGFCALPGTIGACSTGTGLTNETIPVGSTGFAMAKTGGGTGLSSNPWFLLLAVPEITPNTATAPTITDDNTPTHIFTISAGTALPTLLTQTTSSSTSIYDIAGFTNPKGSSSMNAPNMFCDGAAIPCTKSNEINAFGSLPTDFRIFEYTITPEFNSGTVYAFLTSGMAAGTYLAAYGPPNNGAQGFDTPFTTTGLVQPGGTTKGAVPEPASVVLLGTLGAIGAVAFRRKKQLSC